MIRSHLQGTKTLNELQIIITLIDLKELAYNYDNLQYYFNKHENNYDYHNALV